MGKWYLNASLFIFERIFIRVAGIRTGKAWTRSISGLWFPWPIYMFFEMRFDLGTLVSGERLLPFGLLVETSHIFSPWSGDVHMVWI